MHRTTFSMCAGLLLGILSVAHAQTFPSKPIRIIAPFPPGAGTGHHLAGELFKSLAKIDLIHVPYQGGAPAAIAVMGGHTSVLLVNILSTAPFVATGRLRALQLPEVKDIITKIGMNAAGLPATEFDAFLRAELRSNEKIARAVNLRID